MKELLNEIIKQGYSIQKGIYPDNGGGLYASFSFSDRNKYIKWVIGAKRFIEGNFPKDENYIKFKDIVNEIEKELSLSAFNQLMFILESYNANLDLSNSNSKDLITNSLNSNLSAVEIKEIMEILSLKGDETNTKQALSNYFNSIDQSKLENILIDILIKM